MANEELKYRYFAAFVYKYDNNGVIQMTQEKLVETLVQSFGDFAVSPLHQPDEENDGEHWHVIYRHPAPVRLKVAREFLNSIDVPFFNEYYLTLHHPNNYQRYLIHLDNPEKEQFEGGEKAITVINGFPLNLMHELSVPDKIRIQQEIESFAVEYNIFEYASMTVYLSEHAMTEHYLYFTTHTHHFGKFLDSLRYSAEQRKEVSIDA